MSKKHTHQYQRRTMGKDNSYIIYMCVLPNCGHYIPENLVVGRYSLCNYCSSGSLIIHKEQSGLILHKPKCYDCKQGAKRIKKGDKKMHEYIDRVFLGRSQV